MRRGLRKRHSSESSVWIPMTDMLTNTLLILCLFIAVTTLARAMNPKAPSINLEDSAKYRFASGSFSLTPAFRTALELEAMPMIKQTIKCYGSDSIELVGHTDGTPAGGVSNLDQVLARGITPAGMQRLNAGSNADLGLLRALAVKTQIESLLGKEGKGIAYRALSAGSLIGTSGTINPATNKDDQSRRRIEIRFFRTSKIPFLPKCSRQWMKG
jgi:outer membrane protein OmpA-like peptidoglycan-associated protein